MKKLFSALAILIFSISVSLGASFPKGSPKFHTDYNKAMKEAKSKNKPLLVVFSATWCPPCQANKKDVYPSKAVQRYHDNFVWVYLDTDKKKNADVASNFGVSGIPHIQFVSPKGKTIDKTVGGTTPKNFAKTLGKVLKKSK